MKNSQVKKVMHQSLRKLFSFLPHDIRFSIYRSFVDCDPNPDPRLVLKIAETQEELEACFKLLHDAYVSSGFMKPDPSGMRVTVYHALPTTTTLCAKFDGEVRSYRWCHLCCAAMAEVHRNRDDYETDPFAAIEARYALAEEARTRSKA